MKCQKKHISWAGSFESREQGIKPATLEFDRKFSKHIGNRLGCFFLVSVIF